MKNSRPNRVKPDLPQTDDVDLQAIINAFQEHTSARKSFERLLAGGCDGNLVFFLVYGFHSGPELDVLAEERKKPVAFRRSVLSAGKKLRKLQRNLAELDTADMGEFAAVHDFASDRISELDALLSSSEKQAKQISSARGLLRKEIFLIFALEHIRLTTGLSGYQEIADLVECFELAKKRNRIIDKDAIRKMYERHKKQYPDLPADQFLPFLRNAVASRLSGRTREDLKPPDFAS